MVFAAPGVAGRSRPSQTYSRDSKTIHSGTAGQDHFVRSYRGPCREFARDPKLRSYRPSGCGQTKGGDEGLEEDPRRRERAAGSARFDLLQLSTIADGQGCDVTR